MTQESNLFKIKSEVQSSQKENYGSMFTPKTFYFLKIILNATIQDKKLGIPKQFVKKYGKGLPSSVLLTVPSGDTWRVDLTKSDGVVWLQNGWQEFVEFYSIKYGHSLVFKYEGNDKFAVLIFDMSASEIDYPCKSHTEDQRNDEQVSLKPVKEEAKDDTCNETLHETSSCMETRKRSRPQRSNPRKKLKTTQKGKNEKDYEDFSNDEEDLQTKVPKVRDAYKAIEFGKALQKASAFKSENPFFMVLMQPSSTDLGRKMCIPKDFSMKFLKKNLDDVTLCTSDGKTWPARYLRYTTNNKYTKSIIHIGWKEFMQDNKLEEDDICVFELISQTDLVMKVYIFRARQDSSCCYPLGEINSLDAGGNVSLPTPGSTDSKDRCWMRPMTPNKKALAILKANFSSTYPFFMVVMRPRYLTLRCSLSIPYKFVEKNLDEGKDEAILQVLNGRTWDVKLSVKVFSDGQYKAEFSHAWRAFAQENNLQDGDVCVFELINRDENLFKVSIFREAPGANSSVTTRSV